MMYVKIKYIIIFFFILFTIVSLFHNQYKIDEYNHHIPTLEHVSKSNFIEGLKGEGYKSANTPLPYYIGCLVAELFNQEISLGFSRFINILTSFLFLFFLYKYLSRLNVSTFLVLTIIFFYPYVLKTSFTYYQAIYGLLFFALYLLYFEKDDTKSWLLSGLFLTCAILSQQFYLVLIPAKPLYYFFQQYKKSNSINAILTSNFLLLNSLLHFLTLPFAFFLFWIWSGATHPNYQRHVVFFSPTNITAILVIIGFTFFPYFIFNFKKFISRKRLALYLSIAILLTLFFTPEWSQGSDPGKISGYTFHSLEIIGRFSLIIKYILQLGLTVIGLEILYRIYSNQSIEYKIITSLFLLGFILNAVLSERHIIPLIVAMYLALLTKLSDKQLLIWTCIQIPGGIIYFYYLFAYNNY